jgi:hypothetical protein
MSGCISENTQNQERRDMSNENTQDGAEPSGASAGSHVALHRAVRALLEGVNARYAKNPREWTCPHMQALDDMTQSEPQPTLTDAEREAIERSIRYWRGGFRPQPFATVLSQLLRRLQQLK